MTRTLLLVQLTRCEQVFADPGGWLCYYSSMDTFGLNHAQLLPIGAAVYGFPIRSCRIEGSVPVNRGGCGDKALVDLVITTLEGQENSLPVFLKKFAWKGKSEAVHYRQLAQCAVPTPHLYGVIAHPDGEEVLVLERLNQIGFNSHSEAEWRQLLTLLAHLNACAVTRDYLPHLHPFEQGGRIDCWWITGFNPFPPRLEAIEANLRACDIAESELSQLSFAAQRLCERIAALPTGLVHQDFLSDNLGWRGDRAEMVVFDVHKNALAPRFADVAPYLGWPDWSNTATFLHQSPSLREVLIRHYLHEYAHFGGGSVSLETFYEETTLLFWAHKVAILYWMVEQQETERIGQVLNYLRTYTP